MFIIKLRKESLSKVGYLVSSCLLSVNSFFCINLGFHCQYQVLSFEISLSSHWLKQRLASGLNFCLSLMTFQHPYLINLCCWIAILLPFLYIICYSCKLHVLVGQHFLKVLCLIFCCWLRFLEYKIHCHQINNQILKTLVEWNLLFNFIKHIINKISFLKWNKIF